MLDSILLSNEKTDGQLNDRPWSIQSQWFHILVPLSTRLQQHMCIHDENQLLKSRIKLRYHKVLVRLPQTA